MRDARAEEPLPEMETCIPKLAEAVRRAGLDQLPPSHAFDQEGSAAHKLWMGRRAKIDEPIVDTTDPDCEPIFDGGEAELQFVDTDAALDLLNNAFAMSEGPEKEKAIERAKYLLTQTQEGPE